ncbi:hypothetical protein TSMG0023 [Halocynthia phage JM-2012]|uniref:hypothetical protein n=1 Tax=Halocynthia phage JM-2012 TaxID=1173297 RepID=UPI00025C68E6|nr:hypothetical protein TSMG0023 [Halocynthia phage JM-2012]AFI55306.1 hypothetical protein TSMG0023 [Halocynthia phage JM-2012]
MAMSFDVNNRKMDGDKSVQSLTIQGIILTLRDKMTYANITKPTVCKELTDGINEVFNSNFTVYIDPTISQNANVSIPMIDKNNPMWQQVYRDNYSEHLDSEANKELYRASGKDLTGHIDDKGRFHGFMAKAPSRLTVSLDMLHTKTKWQLKPAGAVGIILHEIGHFTNFMKGLGWSVRTNYVLQQVNNRMMGIGDSSGRVKLLKEVAKSEEINIHDDIDYIANVNDEKTTTTVIVGGLLNRMRSELGSDVYDARGFEALSDNFAASHGNGLDLVIALDTMPGSRFQKFGTTEPLILDGLKGMMMLASAVLNPAGASVLMMLSLMFYAPEKKIYDDPKDRFKRVADNLITSLSSNRKGDNKKLIEQIESIHEIMEQYHNKRGVIESIYETVMPSGRRDRSLRELNQNLEDFASNKLYLAAAKFKDMG